MIHEFRADLHCHSTFSDGTYTPEQLLTSAKEIGLKGLSITDHDTVDAYERAIPFAKHMGIDLIHGVEFSARYLRKSVHILGYALDIYHPAVKHYCFLHRERRKTRNLEMIAKLNKHGLMIHYADVEKEASSNNGFSVVGRPHIALALLRRGYVNSIQQAFKLYIGENQKCFVDGPSFSVAETIDVIHQASGKAIIAHPHLIDDNTIIQELIKLNFDGIEGYYSMFLREHQKKWVDLGESKGWIITGGSDFHGDIKPHIKLGCSWINKVTFDELAKYQASK